MSEHGIIQGEGGRGEEPVERDVVDERKHPQLGVKAKKVALRRGGQETHQIEVYKKEKQRFASLDGGGTTERERWVKVTTLSEQSATETLFALAELHGYDLEAK